MPKETVTGATDESVETTSTEESTSSESTTQDSTKKLEEFEARVKEYSEKLEAEIKRRAEIEAKATELEEARKKAEQAKEFEERKYKGLQRETNQKSDEIKRLQAERALQVATQQQLSKIEKLVAKLAENSLDPDAIVKLNAEVESEVQRQELERLRNQVAQAQTATPQNLDPQYRYNLYVKFFQADYPNVNPFDLTFEEWHVNGANTEEEWVALVRAEFEKRSPRIKTPEPTAVMSSVRSELEAQMVAQREEFQKQQAEMQALLAKQKEELDETKRLAQEQLNRSKGMDRSLETIGEPGSSSSTKKIANTLASIPDEMLYSKDPKVREEYSKKLNDKSLRDSLIADALARQARQQ